jgi:hypothetical protein
MQPVSVECRADVTTRRPTESSLVHAPDRRNGIGVRVLPAQATREKQRDLRVKWDNGHRPIYSALGYGT